MWGLFPEPHCKIYIQLLSSKINLFLLQLTILWSSWDLSLLVEWLPHKAMGTKAGCCSLFPLLAALCLFAIRPYQFNFYLLGPTNLVHTVRRECEMDAAASIAWLDIFCWCNHKKSGLLTSMYSCRLFSRILCTTIHKFHRMYGYG